MGIRIVMRKTGSKFRSKFRGKFRVGALYQEEEHAGIVTLIEIHA